MSQTLNNASADTHAEASVMIRLEEDDPLLAVGLWRALTRDAYLLVDRYLRETSVRLRY